ERVAAHWPVALGTVGRFAALAEIADLVDIDLSVDRVEPALARAADRGMVLSDGPVLLLDRVRAIVARRLGHLDEAEQLLRSGMTGRIGAAAYVAMAGVLERTLRGAVRECSGEDIEGVTLGEGVLAVFSSGTHAIEAAARAHDCARAAGFRLHVGIHAGDVLR